MSQEIRLRQLADLHTDGVLTDEEFAAAKQRLLSTDAGKSESQPHQSALRRRREAEAAIVRLDREWVILRDKYLLGARNSRLEYAIPWVFTLVVVVGVGLGLHYHVSPLLMLIVYVGMLGFPLFLHTGNSRELRRAEAEYQRHRAELVRRFELSD